MLEYSKIQLLSRIKIIIIHHYYLICKEQTGKEDTSNIITGIVHERIFIDLCLSLRVNLIHAHAPNFPLNTANRSFLHARVDSLHPQCHSLGSRVRVHEMTGVDVTSSAGLCFHRHCRLCSCLGCLQARDDSTRHDIAVITQYKQHILCPSVYRTS